MSTRNINPGKPSVQFRIPKFSTPRPSKHSMSRSKISQNSNIQEILSFLKSPSHLSKHKSNIFIQQTIYKARNTSASPISRNLQENKKPKKKNFKTYLRKKDFSRFSSHKPEENLRYKEKPLEECESFKNLNGVSTPPEEEKYYDRSISPFSDIIDQDLRNYIGEPSKLSRLELPQKSLGCIEDSYQYSTAESGKRESYKFFFEKKLKVHKPPKTPPPFSIFSKMKQISSIRVRNKKPKEKGN